MHKQIETDFLYMLFVLSMNFIPILPRRERAHVTTPRRDTQSSPYDEHHTPTLRLALCQAARGAHSTAPRTPRYGHSFLVKSFSLSLSLSLSLQGRLPECASVAVLAPIRCGEETAQRRLEWAATAWTQLSISMRECASVAFLTPVGRGVVSAQLGFDWLATVCFRARVLLDACLRDAGLDEKGRGEKGVCVTTSHAGSESTSAQAS